MSRYHFFGVLLFLTAVCYCSSQEDSCDNLQQELACNREELFQLFEHALLSEGENVYKIRDLLFPPTAVLPELVEIAYNVTFTDSDSSVVNSTTMQYGWTTVALYTEIHPALLNQFQPQLPFFIMKLEAYEKVPFLWDGCSELPNIMLQLTIPLCVKAQNMTGVDDILKTLTAHLRYYVLPNRTNILEYYVLDGSFVNGYCNDSLIACSNRDDISFQLTTIPIILFYTLLVIAGIASVTIPLTIIVVFKDWKDFTMKKILRSSNRKQLSFVIGFLIVISLFSYAEIVCEIIAIAKWYQEKCTQQIFKIVLLCLDGGWTIFVTYCTTMYIIFSKREEGISCKSVLFYILFVLPLFCPAVFLFFWMSSIYLVVLLLGFAYPLYVYTLIAIHIAFIFFFTSAFAILVAYLLHFCDTEKSIGTYLKIIGLFVAIFFLIVLATLVYGAIIIGYGLTIIEGLVTTAGAQTAAAFLPSLAIVFASWLIKKRFFGESDDASPATKRIVDKILLYEPLSFDDRYTLGIKLEIPSRKLRKFEIKASQKSNTSEVALTMMIEYWLEKVENNSLNKLAEALEEMEIKEVTKNCKLFGRLRRLQLDIPIVTRDVEQIVKILESDGKISDKLKNEFEFTLKLHCLKRENRNIEMIYPLNDVDPDESKALEAILSAWVKNGCIATWKKLVKALEKYGKIIEASKIISHFLRDQIVVPNTDLYILDGNESLTDIHINAALALLRRQFPHYGLKHLQLPIDQLSKAEKLRLKGIHIIKVSNGYWICCSINYPENNVYLYDSTLTDYSNLNQSLMNQLHTFLPQPSFIYRLMECQQSSKEDSGVYAIANATVLCYGLATESVRGTANKPSEWYEIEKHWKWDGIIKMREHLKKCFTEDNLLTPFPDDTNAPKMTRTDKSVVKQGDHYYSFI